MKYFGLDIDTFNVTYLGEFPSEKELKDFNNFEGGFSSVLDKYDVEYLLDHLQRAIKQGGGLR